MVIYTMSPFLGPVGGPLVAGYVSCEPSVAKADGLTGSLIKYGFASGDMEPGLMSIVEYFLEMDVLVVTHLAGCSASRFGFCESPSFITISPNDAIFLVRTRDIRACIAAEESCKVEEGNWG
jgi:hypothetical protein